MQKAHKQPLTRVSSCKGQREGKWRLWHTFSIGQSDSILLNSIGYENATCSTLYGQHIVPKTKMSMGRR